MDYGLLLELHTLPLAACSYALLLLVIMKARTIRSSQAALWARILIPISVQVKNDIGRRKAVIMRSIQDSNLVYIS